MDVTERCSSSVACRTGDRARLRAAAKLGRAAIWRGQLEGGYQQALAIASSRSVEHGVGVPAVCLQSLADARFDEQRHWQPRSSIYHASRGSRRLRDPAAAAERAAADRGGDRGAPLPPRRRRRVARRSAAARLDGSASSQRSRSADAGDWPTVAASRRCRVASGHGTLVKRQRGLRPARPCSRIANIDDGSSTSTISSTLHYRARASLRRFVRAGDVLVRPTAVADHIGRVRRSRRAAIDAFASSTSSSVSRSTTARSTLTSASLSAATLGSADRSRRVRPARRSAPTSSIARQLTRLPIPVPPLEEQQRIVAEVEERLSAIDAMRRASIERAQRRSQALRAAILERAFRGELVPQDPSDEPARSSSPASARIEPQSQPATGRGIRSK